MWFIWLIVKLDLEALTSVFILGTKSTHRHPVSFPSNLRGEITASKFQDTWNFVCCCVVIILNNFQNWTVKLTFYSLLLQGFALTNFQPISTNTGTALQPGTNVQLKFSTTVLNKGSTIPQPDVSTGDAYQLKLFFSDEDSLTSATARILLNRFIYCFYTMQ